MMATQKTYADAYQVENDEFRASFVTWIEDKLDVVKSSAIVDNRPLPKEEVFDRTKELLYALSKKGIKPMFINPSVDGGIMVEFEDKGIYRMVEIDNEDDIVLLIRDKEKTEAFDLTPRNYLVQILDRI